jgi:hypothetical protein
MREAVYEVPELTKVGSFSQLTRGGWGRRRDNRRHGKRR